MFTSFINHFKTLGKSDRTAAEYLKEARYFASFIRQTHQVGLPDEDLLLLATRADAYDYISDCTKKDLSAATRARKVSSLRSFYHFLIEFDYLTVNPFLSIHRPKVQRKLPVYLSLSDARILIQTARSKKDHFYRRRDTCIIIFFINLGLRLSELANLSYGDIYDDAIRVTGKGDKERYIPLNKSCLRALRLWLSHRGNHHGGLFLSKQGKDISGSSIGGIIKKHIRQAGLNPDLSTHKLRHTCATLLYRYGGVDIRLLQDILGHASIATTEIYTHVVDEQLIEAMAHHPLADF